ncbi:hypothetical protein BH11BAC3_BH11BAC3_48060 [soil metagenome]
MSTLAFSLTIVLFVIFLFIAFTYISNKQKKKAAAMLLWRLNKSGSENNLIFSCRELLNDTGIGVDTAKLKLLFLQQGGQYTYEWNIIDLNLITGCSVKKIYKPAYEGNSSDKNLENYLDKIVLHFEFSDYRTPVEIKFYKHITNNIFEMQELENKASKWQALVCKMIEDKLTLAV